MDTDLFFALPFKELSPVWKTRLKKIMQSPGPTRRGEGRAISAPPAGIAGCPRRAERKKTSGREKRGANFPPLVGLVRSASAAPGGSLPKCRRAAKRAGLPARKEGKEGWGRGDLHKGGRSPDREHPGTLVLSDCL